MSDFALQEIGNGSQDSLSDDLDQNVALDAQSDDSTSLSGGDVSSDEEPPNLLFFALMVFGCSFLVPWNSFLAAIDYLQLVYPTERVEFDFSISYMLPNVIGLIVGLFVGPKMTVNARLYPGFAVYLVVLSLAPFIGGWSLSYGFLVFLLAASGLSDAIVQTGGQGYAGTIRLPQAIQAGLGVSGVLASTLRILTKLMLPNDKEGLQTSSTIFFVSANLIVIAGIASYIWTRETSADEDWRKRVPINVIPVAKALWKPLAATMVTFFITISLFPGTIVQISSTNESLNQGSWFPVINIFFWNLFDFIGKFLIRWPKFSHVQINTQYGYIICLSRLIFFPIFIAAAKGAWKSDFILIPLIMLFGGTNGWLGSYFITYGTDMVPQADKETATLLGNTAIVGGLMLGSLNSIVIKHLFF